MNKFVKYGAFGASLLLCSSLTQVVLAEEVLKTDPIAVEAEALPAPATETYIVEDDGSYEPYTDAADYLKSLAGITAGRFGGHGLDITMRGQSQNQLNVVSDGAYVFGACPNRMDPPTAYLTIQPQDTVTVVQGYQSVLNGFGGTGGSVIVEQNKPELSDELTATGLVEGGYDSNGQMWNAGANVTAGTSKGYATAYTSYKDAEDYKDGDGNKVRSAFTEETGGMKVGYTPSDESHVYLGFDYTNITDALFPGASMDSPMSKAVTFKGGVEHDFDGDVVRSMKLSGYASLADHTMDNYSLRDLSGMAMRIDSESDTYGMKLESDLVVADQPVETLLEWRRNNRDADKIMNATGMLQSVMWPEITMDEIALAGETTYDIGYTNRLVVGGRYDYVHVDYGRADDATSTGSANALYQQFYGITASNKDEHNLGGLLRFEHDYSDVMMTYAGLSRAVRTADATERGLANYMGAGGSTSWVGNPNIKPEKHYQIDAGFDVEKPTFSYGGLVYADFVDDYILRDSARSQDGILVDFDGADIYRNIDAVLTGVSAHGQWQFDPRWTLHGDATYTYGQDVDAGRALPQIPPLQGKIGVSWQATDYLSLATNMNWAFQQTRVDTDSTDGTGRDVGQTSGYATFDLEGTLTEFEPVSLNFGVTNIFDQTYASHLNRSNVSDPTEVQVNEPGRSFYVQLKMSF